MSDTYDPAFEQYVSFFRRHERLVAIVNLRWRTAPADIKAACRERLSNPADAVFHWRPITATTVKRHCGTVLISFPDRIKRDQAITELAGLKFNGRLATIRVAYKHVRLSRADAAAATAATPRPQFPGPWSAGPPTFPAWPHQSHGPWQTGAPQWTCDREPPAPAPVAEVVLMPTPEVVMTEAPALTPVATAASSSAAHTASPTNTTPATSSPRASNPAAAPAAVGSSTTTATSYVDVFAESINDLIEHVYGYTGIDDQVLCKDADTDSDEDNLYFDDY
ncbi:hypothetical protein PWT90_06867 [Aphanocladium album]|nr:hypothetical protein PWT90_06867 [Aphanocladium album]